MAYTLGSLFDGSGGFPLAGAMCGITPVWASEVEPYPIAVTKTRLPSIKHLGDITKINGAEIEPVDIITFGSPCQDLSVAGKRAGLKHSDVGDEETTRSGLFMEAVRIIKEMRRATNGVYPRFALWENVPGAFSSNKGEDLRVVLEELIKIVEPTAVMPSVPKTGWPYADSYVGNGWSLAYRVFDAQYWGVPQRRRRIHLVADFRGECARKVLFEREGLRGYFAEGGTPWKGITPDVERGVVANDTERNSVAAGFCPEQSAKTRGIGYEEEIAPTLRSGVVPGVCFSVDPYNQTVSNTHQSLRAQNDIDHTGAVIYAVENHPADSRVNIDESGKVQTLTSRMGTGGGNVPMVMEPKIYRADTGAGGDVCNTLVGDHNNRVTDYTALVVKSYGFDPSASRDVGVLFEEEVSKTLTNGTAPGHHAGVVIAETEGVYWDGSQTVGTLTANNAGGNQRMPDKENFNCVIVADDKLVIENKIRYIVRRLTPTECARLQGFADRWGDIEPKTEFSNEEYKFWLDVRNTHAAMNGKQTKDYTPKQMLTWYNKLQTDSAEYKMWGNGIALPPALYCLQGMAEVLHQQ